VVHPGVHMKMKAILLVLLLVTTAVVSAQSIETLFELSAKSATTVADFASMSPALVEIFPERDDVSLLLEKQLKRYDPAVTLTKGRASLLLARAIGLKSSLFFILMPSERSAFRAFVADGLFSNTSSTGDGMTGVEIMDLISRVAQLYGATE